MIRKLIAVVAIAPMLCISLGFQSYALYFVIYDMLAVGKVNFGAVFAYVASVPFSLSAHFVASTLIYNARIDIPMKLVHCYYFALHVAILSAIFVFPGSFSP